VNHPRIFFTSCRLENSIKFNFTLIIRPDDLLFRSDDLLSCPDELLDDLLIYAPCLLGGSAVLSYLHKLTKSRVKAKRLNSRFCNRKVTG